MPDVGKKLCAVHERSSHRHRFRFDFSFILSAKHLQLFRLSRIMKNVYEIKMKRTAIKSSTWTRARQLTLTNSFESHTHICIYLIWSLCTYTIPFKNTAQYTIHILMPIETEKKPNQHTIITKEKRFLLLPHNVCMPWLNLVLLVLAKAAGVNLPSKNETTKRFQIEYARTR